MLASEVASSGLGRPVGAATAGVRPAPASDKARASRKRAFFNMSGSPSAISLLSLAIGSFSRRANGSTRSVFLGLNGPRATPVPKKNAIAGELTKIGAARGYFSISSERAWPRPR